MRKLVVFLLLIALVAQAENYVVINSMDGRDVLSGIYYGNVMDYTVKFMPYPNADAELLALKVGSGNDVLLIQSRDQPVSTFLRDAIEKRGSTVELYESSDAGETNLDLALKSKATRFIIVDSNYSDAALSVMPYAALRGSYVLLSHSGNADRIKNIVENGDEIIIYGYVDSAVKEALSDLNPTYIGKGEDRYEDNVELVRLTMDEYAINSAIYTEGRMVEEGMVASKLPFVFSGRIVPQVTYDFTKEMVRQDRLKTVYLIGGTEITGAIRNMRDEIEEELLAEGMNKTFGIWVRYAQAVPKAGTGVTNLDTFPLPAYIPSLNISEVIYNKATQSLMIRLDNIGDGPAYYLTDISIKVDGVDYKVFGDTTTQLIEYGDVAGLQYPLDLSEIQEGEITAEVVIKYGSGKNTLEEYAYYAGPIAEVEYIDSSNVIAKSAKYNADEQVIVVTLRNTQDETAYVSSDIEVVLEGEKIKIRGQKNDEIPSNTMVTHEYYVELKDQDLADNEEVKVYLDYGARAGFLVNNAVYPLPLEYEAFPWVLVIVAVVVLVIAALIVYYLVKRKRKPEGKKPYQKG